ncbi:MAG: metallophosphoesterase [Planctomycetes bacterium]|nr:metallophosphoesterase [Planctomycetota bacterium]
MDQFTRRDLLRLGAAAAAGLTAAEGAWAGEPAGDAAVRKGAGRRTRRLRIAHVTDVHVQPELEAERGMAACLHHVQSQKDKPDVILNGGDALMDLCAVDRARAKTQWDCWNGTLKRECSMRVEHCIGNHDIWGIAKSESRCDGSEDFYGKKWALDGYGITRPYRSFDLQGWHFIVLDSTMPVVESYVGRLDETQFEWLADDLKKTDAKKPVLILSHIPILSAAVFYDGELEKTGKYEVPPGWLHIDSRRIKNLFLQHPNVNVCLSGHLHLIDRVEYNGVTYLCDGAVSGNWWKGAHQECHEGYALVDLYNDGTIEREYVTYGWQAKKA